MKFTLWSVFGLSIGKGLMEAYQLAENKAINFASQYDLNNINFIEWVLDFLG